MARRVQHLTTEHLAQFPADCQECLFWELGQGRPRDTSRSRPDVTRAGLQKHAWLAAQGLEEAAPGRAVVDGDVLIGWVIFAATTAFAPRGVLAPTASPDALLLASAWIDPSRRGEGIGRLLVQAAVKEALHRDLDAVEAYGDQRWKEGGCVLPATWLLHEGFEVSVAHPRSPLLRLETSRTVRWADALGHAVDEVMERLPRRAPVRAPEALEQTRQD